MTLSDFCKQADLYQNNPFELQKIVDQARMSSLSKEEKLFLCEYIDNYVEVMTNRAKVQEMLKRTNE